MSDPVLEAIAMQIPAAVLFAIFSFGLFVYFLRFIENERNASREERAAFLKTVEKISESLDELKDEIRDNAPRKR